VTDRDHLAGNGAGDAEGGSHHSDAGHGSYQDAASGTDRHVSGTDAGNPDRTTAPTARQRFAGFARLVRVPNLFTAPPDVLVGASLGVAAGGSLSFGPLAGLAVAAVLLYAAGTTLNDYFDAPVDARERPERPIPSGLVSRREAGTLGALLIGGVVVAVLSVGSRAGAVAAALALMILLYDGRLEGGPAGFLAMGTTRGLDVWLGAAAAGGLFPSVAGGPAWPPAVPAVVALYIAAVTAMAETEVEGGNRRIVAVAFAGAVGATLALWAVAYLAAPPPWQAVAAIGLGIAFLAWTGNTLRATYVDPSPGVVGPAVGTCVLALVVLNAGFAAVTDLALAVGALAFLLPAVGFSTVFDVS